MLIGYQKGKREVEYDISKIPDRDDRELEEGCEVAIGNNVWTL